MGVENDHRFKHGLLFALFGLKIGAASALAPLFFLRPSRVAASREWLLLALFTLAMFAMALFHGSISSRDAAAVVLAPAAYFAGLTMVTGAYRLRSLPLVYMVVFLVANVSGCLALSLTWLDESLLTPGDTGALSLDQLFSGRRSPLTFYGTYAALIFAPLFAAWAVNEKGKMNGWLVTTIAVSAVALLLSILVMRRFFMLSLLALLLFFGLLQLYLFLSRGKPFNVKALTVFAIPIVGFVFGLYFYAAGDIGVLVRRLEAFPRFSYWAEALRELPGSPLGRGTDLGAGPRGVPYHNTWLDLWRRFGVVPAVLLLMFQMSLVLRLVRFCARLRPPLFDKVMFGTLFLVLLMAFAYERIFDGYMQLWVFSFFAYGLFFSADRSIARARSP